MTTENHTELPLAGIRVVDVATVIAGPYCASILGEFGAEVIKVEHPLGGDALRRFGTPTECGDTLTWLSEARNKKSVTIDLHHPEGVDLFKQLISQSDILCENFRPGTLEKWGLGWDVLREVNPRIDHAPRHRLRADRSLQESSRLRSHRPRRRRPGLSFRHAQGRTGDARVRQRWATT